MTETFRQTQYFHRHIEEKYGGHVPTFLKRHSKMDREILRKKGVKFYQEIQ